MRFNFLFFAVSLFLNVTLSFSQVEVYLSFSDFGKGDSASNTSIQAQVGDVLPVYAWATTDIPIGEFSYVVDNPTPDYQVNSGEVFNPGIIVNPGPDQTNGGMRWGGLNSFQNSGGYQQVGVASLGAFGLNPLANGDSGFIDELFDVDEQAFLFGRIDVEVLQSTVFELNINFSAATTVGDSFLIPNRTVTINAIPVPEPNGTIVLFATCFCICMRGKRAI